MSLFVASLNSGSNGNCYYAGNAREAILIDAGISCREIEKRMKRIGLNIHKVKAVFISHEHSDHIKGMTTLSKKYDLPVYITATTLLHGRFSLEDHLVRLFSPHEQVSIGDITITPFPKLHDACDPCSFLICCHNTRIGIFTDIGASCKHVIDHFKICNAAFLEANYDHVMLEQGTYPYYLKKRISGGMGHLSNSQALELFIKHRPAYMSHLFLSHLSKNNNCPLMVEELFKKYAGATQIIIASRDVETPVYFIRNSTRMQRKISRSQITPHQLTFSFQ